MNGMNGANACKLAGYKLGSKHKDVKDIKNINSLFAVISCENIKKPNVKEAINRIAKNEVHIDTTLLAKTLYDEWLIMATYDPSMFIDKYGRSKFDKLEDIPKEYRCCVENISTKYSKDLLDC